MPLDRNALHDPKEVLETKAAIKVTVRCANAYRAQALQALIQETISMSGLSEEVDMEFIPIPRPDAPSMEGHLAAERAGLN